MTELYYVEDDQNIGDIVKRYLEQRGFVVTLCGTTGQARKLLGTRVPSLVLLDWNMPDGDGAGLCRWIRRCWRKLPVIFLTVRDDPDDIISGFQSGADDYVVKPFDLGVLYSRIRAVLRRSDSGVEPYLSCGGITLDRERRTVARDSEEIALTAVEYQLLLYLMENKGRTVTRERILGQVWDVNENYVNDNTLTVTMKRLRDKLRQPACIKTVRSVGYRMEDV